MDEEVLVHIFNEILAIKDGIPAELFQIWKDDAVKVLHSVYQQIWKIQQWPRTGKGQFSFQSQRKAMPKNAQKHTIALISHASKVMLQILQVRLQQYVNHELTDVQAGFRKGRGTRDQIAGIRWIIEKASELQKKSISALLTMPKHLTMWITANCGKFFRRWEYQTTLPVSWETYMWVKKGPLEPDTKQQTGSKLGKEYVQVYIRFRTVTLLI